MQKYLAEFLGTLIFAYVFLVTAGNAIAIGATLAILMMILGPISGGLLNPAFVFVKAFTGDLPIKEVIPYCFAQLLGGLTAVQIFQYVSI